MRISAKSEYAIKAVLDLAMHPEVGLVPIQEIAARQGIPQRYLEQVLIALKRGGLVRSKRGSAGGYHLTRPPEDITVGDVLRAVEGASAFEALGGRKPNRNGQDLAELWTEISEAVSSVVDRLTFGELASRAAERVGAGRMMYHI
ncbi:MAG: Rrf2 family transcriptional regulator [Candidatus Rokubacteria bacterium]|nr:Rrf2 family transcriptional regulator [Candidatus Rokubacteria bacterium]